MSAMNNKKILKTVSLCSGIGCSERGINNTSVFECENVGTSEIDINAIICYAAIHCGLTEEMIDNFDFYADDNEMRQYLTDLNIGYSPEKNKSYDWFKTGVKFARYVKKVWLACLLSKNLGDVSKIEQLPEADVWFLSMPCQSISVAGKMEGLAENSGTRSSLVWQTLRLLQKAKDTETLPKFMVLENVKNLVSKKFLPDFEKLNERIGKFGYNVYYKILNACETGVPQHRERVFVMYIRKDFDNGLFAFPQPFDNGLRLNNILEDNVDESYYIDTEKAETLIVELVKSGRIDVEEYIKRMEY